MTLSLALSIPIGAWSPYLRACLSSIALQQNENVFVAILDASLDQRVKEDIKLSGLRTSYERFGKDLGQSAAIDEGWSNTQSDLIGWLNVDDFLLPNTIQLIFQKFEDHPAAAAVFGQSTVSIEGAIAGLHPAVRPMSDLIMRTNIVSQPSCFMRRSAIEAIGGINVTLTYTMDWDLWVRLYQNGWSFRYIDQVFSHVTLARDTKTAALNVERFLEFAKILLRTQPIWSVAKGIIAMARQNFGTYWASSSYAFLGFDATSISALPFINTASEPRNTLRVMFKGVPNLESISFNANCAMTLKGNSLTCRFEESVQCGDSVIIFQGAKPRFSAEIISAQWWPDAA